MSNNKNFLFSGSVCTCVILLAGCSSSPIAVESIPWKTKNLRLENCPSIDGLYHIIPRERDVISEYVISNIFSAPYDNIIFSRDNPDEYAKSKERKDQLRFAQERLVSIRIDSNILSATEFNTSGKRFTTWAVNFSPVLDATNYGGKYWRVGCLGGSYITRSVELSSNYDAGKKAISWKENHIRKLANGDIQTKEISCFYRSFDGANCGSAFTLTFPVYDEKGGAILRW